MARTVVRIEFNRFPQIAAKLPRETRQIVEETTLEVEADIKVAMAAEKSGRIYGSHQASAPGEAPAVDTSVLINSIQREVQGTEGAVYTNQETAAMLEFGTSRMAPRPAWVPAAERAREGFVRKMRDLEGRLD
jgi:hypothetical protein